MSDSGKIVRHWVKRGAALIWVAVMYVYHAGPEPTVSEFARWAAFFGHPNLPVFLAAKSFDSYVLTFFFVILLVLFLWGWVCPLYRKPLLPASVPVTKIAEYLLNGSAWGRKELSRLNYIESVQFQVSTEMTRAAREGDVIFTGIALNAPRAVNIDRIYWQRFYFDHDRIWDERNGVFTGDYGVRPIGMTQMQFGAASRDDVLKMWPPATLCQKIRSNIWVSMKHRWWALKASFSCH